MTATQTQRSLSPMLASDLRHCGNPLCLLRAPLFADAFCRKARRTREQRAQGQAPSLEAGMVLALPAPRESR